MRIVNLTGRRFGRLVALRREGKIGREFGWLCQCDCGRQPRIRTSSLRIGNSTSCGCGRLEACVRASRTHGMTGTKLHRAWKSMVARCTYSTATGYRNYGGRGIRVCDAWRASFEAFARDVGQPPSSGHSIDRIDNEGNYEPGNIRWATSSTQRRNQRPRRRRGLPQAGEAVAS